MKTAAIFLGLLLLSGTAYAADPIRPDPRLTPGKFHVPPTPLAILCTPGYTKTVRHVPDSVKDAVFRRYGYVPEKINKGDYEVDHLGPLEIDGTNDIENLWIESYLTQPLNAHRKDVLEGTLHRLVCQRKLPLAVAQQAIATDWVAAYNKYVVPHKS